MYAAQNGSAMACELLLYYGARIDIRNPKGQTAIDLAHYWGHRYLVWLLENTLFYQRRAMMNPYLRQLMFGANSHSY
jgi:ankyrin repeat protein